MPIAPDIHLKQANKYSGFLAGELSLKKRTFQRNPVSVKVLTRSILAAGPSIASLVGATPPGLKELGGTLGRLRLGVGTKSPLLLPPVPPVGDALLLGLVLGELPGLRLLGLVVGEVPGLALLGVPPGEVPGLALLGLLGFAVPAGVVIGAPAASLVMVLGLGAAAGAPRGLFAGALAGLPAAGAVFWGAALLPHKLIKSKVVPLGVSMKQTGTFTWGFEAIGKSAVPGMGRLKAASAITGVNAADRAAIVRNNLISVSSNVEFYFL